MRCTNFFQRIFDCLCLIRFDCPLHIFAEVACASECLPQDATGALEKILQQPGQSDRQKHALLHSFLRRLRSALPAAYYEVTEASGESCSERSDWWLPETTFHAAQSAIFTHL